jgi:hypothetical protein
MVGPDGRSETRGSSTGPGGVAGARWRVEDPTATARETEFTTRVTEISPSGGAPWRLLDASARGERLAPVLARRSAAAGHRRRCGGPRPRPVETIGRPLSIAGAEDGSRSKTSAGGTGARAQAAPSVSNESSSPSPGSATSIEELDSHTSRRGRDSSAELPSTAAPVARAELDGASALLRTEAVASDAPTSIASTSPRQTHSGMYRRATKLSEGDTRRRPRVEGPANAAADVWCGVPSTHCLLRRNGDL